MSLEYMNDEINYVRLHQPKPLLLHGFVSPFIALYAVWIAFWVSNLGFYDYIEAGFIGIALIAMVQILTCLFCFWSISIRCWMSCYSVDNIESASLVEVVPVPNNGYPELLSLHKGMSESSEIEAWFVFQKVKYYYDVTAKGCFREVAFQTNLNFQYYSESKGYTDDEIIKTSKMYGPNSLQMDIPSFSELFKERATAPFFVFQVFCVGLWCLDEYWYYSIFTLLMLIAFEATLVQQQLRNMAEIRRMGNRPYLIQVYRNRRWRPMVSDQLLPGDIISIGRSQDDNLVPCDLLLLRGSCIVDESMLTGESVPVMKEPIENEDLQTCLNLDVHGKLHVLFGGTKVVQNSSPVKNTTGLKATDSGCLAFVLRHGFSTSQGRLLRTILFGVKRVTANNFETFMFILFLLVFAVTAAIYVWVNGSVDPTRNKYKLFLECALILTSVIPPELPIELSLAVNNSLLALTKLYVFCTEPFRIPFAGKVDICCFDKTGTLTSDNLVVQGVAGLKNDGEMIMADALPLETQHVLATCHSLMQFDDALIGDPLEKITLQAIQWNLTKGDAVIPRRGGGLKIYQRFHFSSMLRCMCVIAGQTVPGSTEVQALATVKGAPEVVRNMLKIVPLDFDDTFSKLARQGARVLALAFKPIGVITNHQIKELTRPMMEKDLNFAGFLVISCPLKPDSKAVIKEIKNASHRIVMITGDNALTACHVSSELHISKKQPTLILTSQSDSKWFWKSIDENISLPIQDAPTDLTNLFMNYNLCITGEGLMFLSKNEPSYLEKILSEIKIFSRVAPKQKELIITSLNRLGFITLMCGDGTNDVGALKHAHIGVALLTHAPSIVSKKKTDSIEANGSSVDQKLSSKGKSKSSREANSLPPSQTKMISDRLKMIEEEERRQIVRLGDASIAAPFTSKLSTTLCVCHIIKQGRCTLVTTLQMFKILALNALILAYSQSVLYLDGVKFSDTQATMQGLLLAGCFLFISRSKPLDVLSSQRPLPNIFNVYTILTVIFQFFVHFASLVHLKTASESFSPNKTEGFVDLEAKFSPNLINSTIYVLAIAMQVTTFAVNYKGHPFMASLFENRPLLYSLMVSTGVILGLSAGLLPDISEQLQLVEFTPKFRNIVLTTLFFNFFGCLLVDRILQFLFGRTRFKE